MAAEHSCSWNCSSCKSFQPGNPYDNNNVFSPSESGYPTTVSYPTQLVSNDLYMDSFTQDSHASEGLQPLTISGQPNEVLDLRSKDLEDALTPRQRTFFRCCNYHTLLLDANRLHTLPEDVCAMTSLKELSVQSQVQLKRCSISRQPALTIIPPEIANLTSLNTLRLGNNSISNLPHSLAQLTNLQILDLRLNTLQDFPIPVLSLVGLKNLTLSGNYIHTIPDGICALEHLEVLRVSNNKLTALPSSLGQLPCLHTLSARKNLIKELPPSLANNPGLQHWPANGKGTGINVDDNPLQYPPSDICSRGTAAILQYLQLHTPRDSSIKRDSTIDIPDDKIINLSNQSLKSLPRDLTTQAEGKVHLIAKHNFLRQLPDSLLRKFKDLEYLNLNSNSIVKFPWKALKQLPRLKILSMDKQMRRGSDLSDYQTLSNISTGLIYLKNLEELYLSDNKMTEFPAEIHFLANLRVLDLQINCIREIPDTIGSLNRLECLSLSNNKIVHVPKVIGELTNLIVLRLSANRITELPHTLCTLVKLQTLSLRNNGITSLPAKLHRLTGLLSGKEYSTKIFSFPCGLKVENNPITFPPAEIIADGVEEIFDYLRELERHPNGHLLALPKGSPIRELKEKRLFTVLSDQFLMKLSRQICPEWLHLGTLLGISLDEIDKIKINASRVEDASREMLQLWRNGGDHLEERGMAASLIKALEKVRRNDVKIMVQEALDEVGWST